ncbi:MAG: dihydrofolate reductase [Casimicrobiaceae bacterium]
MALSHGTIAAQGLALRQRAQLSIVAAIAANGVIGDGLRLPWNLPADLAHFRRLTTGHSIIMGRRTWQSLKRALPQRQNIVVSRQAAFAAEGADVADSLPKAVALAHMPSPLFVIGGAALFAEAMAAADTLYLTEVHADYPGNVRFPPFDATHWRETAREPHPAAGDAPAFSFVTHVRDDS